MVLLFDNYDSFTYNLADLLLRQGLDLKVIRNDELNLEEIKALAPAAIVISPGPGRPENAGLLMEFINEFHSKLPILGICLGQQAIGVYFGADLVYAKRCMHGKVSEIKHNSHPMFEGVPNNTEMMRYHSLILNNLPNTLVCTATSEEGEVMAIAHNDLPIWGVQFHPESILSTNGPQIIRNWLTHFQLIK